MICRVGELSSPRAVCGGQGARRPPTHDETPGRLRPRRESNAGRFAPQTHVTWTLSCPVTALTMAPVSWEWC